MRSGPPEKIGGMVKHAVEKLGGDRGSGEYDSKGLGGRIYDSVAGREDVTNMAHWMPSRKAFSIKDEVLEVLVPSEFHAGWLKDKYQATIYSATEDVSGGRLSVKYVVDEVRFNGLEKDVVIEKVEKGEQAEIPRTTENFRPKRPSYIHDPCSDDFDKKRKRLIFPGLGEDIGDHYVRHDGNKMAGAICRKIFNEILRGEESSRPVLLYGDPGVGKTTLVKSLVESLTKKGIMTGFIDIEQVVQYLIRSKGKYPDVFSYLDNRDTRMLVFEGIEALAVGNRPGAQTKIDGVMRGAVLRGIPVIATCANRGYEEVISYIKCGEVKNLGATLENMSPILMEAPKGEDTARLVEMLFSKKGLRVKRGESLEAIARAVVKNFPEGSSAKYIDGKVGSVILASEVYDKPLSMDLVESALIGGVQARLEEKTPENIISGVAEKYSITSRDLIGKRRDGILPTARSEVALQMKDELGLSNRLIGDQLGGMHPSSVLAAIKRARGKQ